MKLHVVDILIICAYLIVIVLIGLFLKKKAAKNMDSYFLGGKYPSVLYARTFKCFGYV